MEQYQRLKDLDNQIHQMMNDVFNMEDSGEKELKKIRITELMDERDRQRKLAITGFMPRVMRGFNTKSYNHIKTRDELADDTPIFEHDSIEDLEDYLQEIFDKYNIIPKNQQIPPRGVMAYDDNDSQIYYSITKSVILGNSVTITNIDRETSIEISNDISKILPNLERRLGHKLDIDYGRGIYGSTYYLRVKYGYVWE